jgi:DNA anti-recombination protein RmuC
MRQKSSNISKNPDNRANAMDAETKRYLDKMDRRWNEQLKSILDHLQTKNEKATWITANQVNKRFGITAKELARMRTLGQIEFKQSRGGGWLYKLESVPEVFKKVSN